MIDIEKMENQLKKFYGSEPAILNLQKKRYASIHQAFKNNFGREPEFWLSAPGRTELGGNHTDHNHGRVLAASVNLDAVAAVSKTREPLVTFISEGYPQPMKVNLDDLNKKETETGTTTALIRGMAAYLKKNGYAIGGFNAYVQSDVLPGSGLSSSAAIEVLIGTIFNHLYNQGKISAEKIAIGGQFAENVYFDKPCGLMDQMACAMGGIITIDFENPQAPQVERVNFDFPKQGYRLIVVDTGGNHADLTDEYAAIPSEMMEVARTLGKNVCREITFQEWLDHIPMLRKSLGDRAVLRAFHFIQENERVLNEVEALKENNFSKFLQLVNASGNSSFKWLQNIFSPKNTKEESIALALALSEEFIEKIGEGACRVHGGGFAGTIQVFLPAKAVDEYTKRMETVFGEGSVKALNIRPIGSGAV